jgi:hypothetical protein
MNFMKFPGALAVLFLFMGNRGGLLAPLDHTNGKPLWRLLFWGSAVESDPVLAGEVLYIGSSDLRRVSAIRSEERPHYLADRCLRSAVGASLGDR